MDHLDLNSLTPKEYFKLHGTLPASVIEILLEYEDALSNIKNFMDDICAVELHEVDYFEDVQIQLSQLETELKAVLVPEQDAMLEFNGLKADAAKLNDLLASILKRPTAIKTKLEEFTCNI